MRILIADDNGNIFASHEFKDVELTSVKFDDFEKLSLAVSQTQVEHKGFKFALHVTSVIDDIRAYRAKKLAEKAPKAGAQCEHGFHWYAETDSANPEFPVGSLSIDCSTCETAVPLSLRVNKHGA